MAVYVKDEPNVQESTPNAGQGRRGIQIGCLGQLLIGLGAFMLVGGMLMMLLNSLMFTPPTVIEDNTIYRIDMTGMVVEQAPSDVDMSEWVNSMMGAEIASPIIGLDDLLSNIALAKSDDKVLGIYLHGGELEIGPASAKAFRDALLDFKKSGKFVIAYATNYTQVNYYIASVADKVYISPVGILSWDGLSAQTFYYKRLLDTLGVEAQILKVGSYKSAVEPFCRTSMSEEERQQTEGYLKGIWDVMKEAVASSRRLTTTQLDQYADLCMSLQPQQTYVDYGLVDALTYVQDVEDVLATCAGTKEYKVLTHASMNNVERVVVEADDKVAVWYLEGEIFDAGYTGIVAPNVIEMGKKIAEDESVKAVVLRVNSPGGSAVASEEIWYTLKKLQDKGLPVVVSMGDYAASGGYYISCNADYIYAEPTTLTGSIGIFGIVPDLKGLADMVGLDIDTVSTHAHSSFAANPLVGMNSKEQAQMQAHVERGYDLFTKRCAEGRGLPQDSIKAVGEGRVWTGADAVKLGLVDQLGNIDDAIQKAISLAGIESYEVIYYPEKEELPMALFEMFSSTTQEERIGMAIREYASQPRVMTLMPQVTIK